MTTTVLVVDDEALLRTAFTSLIEAEDDLRVLGEAADGKEAVELAARLSPDVVVMDVRMPGMDGIEATRRITAARNAKAPRILILTTFDLDEYVFDALRAGASGFSLKSRPVDELLGAIRVVAAGEALLAPTVTRRLIAHFSQRGRSDKDELTLNCSPSANRSATARRPGTVQHRDHEPTTRQPPDGQDPREPHPFQARCPRPHSAGRPRLRVGVRRDHLIESFTRLRHPSG